MSDEVIQRLRGQLQNCVNHLEQAKRKSYGTKQKNYEHCIEQANKCLYETLHDLNNTQSDRITELEAIVEELLTHRAECLRLLEKCVTPKRRVYTALHEDILDCLEVMRGKGWANTESDNEDEPYPPCPYCGCDGCDCDML